MEESTQHFEYAAEAIAPNPRLWRTLLFAHTPNHVGNCHTCYGMRWPCGPRVLAERAEEIHAGA